MIFRERVGGGGRVNWSLGWLAADDRRRDLTVSLGWPGCKTAEEVECSDEVASVVTAGGGSSKASCREAIFDPSWPLMSVDEAGVGRKVRGIVLASKRNSPVSR